MERGVELGDTGLLKEGSPGGTEQEGVMLVVVFDVL